MNELIDKYRSSITYKTNDIVLNKYCYLMDVYDKLEQFKCGKEDITPKGIIEAFNNIDYFDICYASLITYYDFSLEEAKEKGKYLLKFIGTDAIHKSDKEYLIRFISLYRSANFNTFLVNRTDLLRIDIIKYKMEGFFKEVIEILEELVVSPYFTFFYGNLTACFCEKKPVISEKRVAKYLNKIDDLSRINMNLPKNSDYKYLTMYISNCSTLASDILISLNKYAYILDPIESKNKSLEKIVEENVNEIIRIFKNDNVDDFIAMDDVIKLRSILKNEELFNFALIKIIEHNNKYMDSKNLDKHKKIISIKNVIMEHNYDIEDLDDNIKLLLDDNSNFDSFYIEKLKGILNDLDKYNILLTNDNLSLLIKICFSGEVFIKIDGLVKDLISKGCIDNYYINNNLAILYDNNYLTEFISKVNILLKYNIPVRNVLYSGIDIMSVDIQQLVDNIEIFSMYKIDYNDVNNRNFEFLVNDSLFNIIDLFIEEDLLEVIRKHSGYIQEKYLTVVKRIHINHLIGAKVRTLDNNSIDKNLMKEKNYYLANDDLDEFLCNHTSMYESAEIKSYLNNTKRNKISSETLNSDIVKLLDESVLCGENYLFGSTIISRIKFLRNIEVFINSIDDYDISELVFNCLISNSYLLIDELKVIEEYIINLFKDYKVVLSKKR